MRPGEFVPVVFLALAIYSPLQVFAIEPFSAALEALQNEINYTFDSIVLLRRAVTHASFSEENNKALSILGASVIEASIALKSLAKDIDISPKDLNRKISEVCNMESSCAKEGSQLGLQKVVRVSPKTDSSSPAVVCGAFRAVIGAIAVDTGNFDDAGRVFVAVLDGKSASRRASSR
ncbi:protein NUCLEAR FUSION DEFECTIVE 2 [Rhododendron vialii]|uniref:protein NUCLEAR FUSION DEFECTIVE 2 n=1 Tax=Rhododendron vialii TaxID=182163 RepID=UPI00265F7583|nr:protein NUCLEAR FUSION DEFECTIVE 2 [Rhododendron vialii]